MSFSAASLHTLAGIITGALLTPAVMITAAETGKRLSETEHPLEDTSIYQIGGAIAGATLLLGILGNRGETPFFKGMHTSVKIIAIGVSAFVTAGLGVHTVINTTDISVGMSSLLISTIVGVFLGILSTHFIHPMIGPVVGAVTALAITCTISIVLLKA